MDDPGANAYASYDQAAVRFFDIAHEGAQLRAVAQATGRLSHLTGMRPRSVVIVATDSVAQAAAHATVAWVGQLDVPVTVARTLPAYVGALDVVIVAGAEASRERDLRALLTAAARGAEVILAGPGQGLLIDDAPADTIHIPALPTAAGVSPARTMGVLGAVLGCLAQPADLVAERLELIADEVDAELQALSPERDEAVNPGRQLRAWAEGARVVHTGVGLTSEAVAQLAAAVWTSRGIASGYLPADELPEAQDAANTGAGAVPRDVFYDPFIDGPSELVGLKAVVWACDGPEGLNANGARVESVEDETADPAARAMRLVTRAFAATALG